VAPLDVSLRERLIDLTSTVRCNGQQAYTTSYLVGTGTPLPLVTSWAVAWSSQESKIKFYESTSRVGKTLLVEGNVDFGVVSDGLSSDLIERDSDVALMPITAYALVPGTLVSLRARAHTRTQTRLP
jgi:ABC-type phosphate transport system substrate-binding protein